MRFGGNRVNPYLYRQGGNIVGDYMYLGNTKIRMKNTADIELAKEEARVQQAEDNDNYICFQDGRLFVSKDLEVAGTIHGHSTTTDDLHVHGQLEVDGGTILHGAVYCYATVQGTAGIFSGAVTALTGMFGTVQSATTTAGALSALTLNCP